MKAWILIAVLMGLGGVTVGEDSIRIAPIPPVGARITKDSEGVIRIEMTESGTVVLGTGSVISREGNRPDLPGRYHIEFGAMGKIVSATGDSDVSLVVYLDRGDFEARPAHGGTVLLSGSKDWERMRTTFLAKSGGAGKVENVILGIHFEEPGIIELKDLSCQAVDLPSE